MAKKKTPDDAAGTNDEANAPAPDAFAPDAPEAVAGSDPVEADAPTREEEAETLAHADAEAPPPADDEAAKVEDMADPVAPASYDPVEPEPVDHEAVPADGPAIFETEPLDAAAEAEAREEELAESLEQSGSGTEGGPADPDPFAEPVAAYAPDDDPDERRDEARDDFRDDHRADAVEEHDETAGSSLAARALQVLVILLIGAALALWLAPKAAPYLPEPMARMLSAPDVVTSEQLAALRADMETALAERTDALASRVEELGAAPQGGDVSALEERLAALEGTAADSPAAAADAGAVTEVSNAVSDLRARLSALEDNLSGVSGEGGALPEAAAERLAGFAAVVESLRAEMEAVSGRTAELAKRLDEAEAAYSQKAGDAEAAAEAAEAAAKDAERRAVLAGGFRTLAQALEEGEPFEDTLTEMSALAQPPEALSAAAAQGVPTLAALRARFTDAGRRAMEAEGLAQAGDGFADRLLASVQARLAGVPVDEVGGQGLESALGRCAARLRDGDLAGAVEALDGISDAAREAMQPWPADAQARLAAEQAASSWRAETLGGE